MDLLMTVGVNSLEKIILQIDKLQGDLFAYRIDQVASLMINLVESLTAWVMGLTADEQAALNQVLSALLTSYEKKDYLLVADLLEFELKPLLLELQSEHQG